MNEKNVKVLEDVLKELGLDQVDATEIGHFNPELSGLSRPDRDVGH